MHQTLTCIYIFMNLKMYILGQNMTGKSPHASKKVQLPYIFIYIEVHYHKYRACCLAPFTGARDMPASFALFVSGIHLNIVPVKDIYFTNKQWFIFRHNNVSKSCEQCRFDMYKNFPDKLIDNQCGQYQHVIYQCKYVNHHWYPRIVCEFERNLLCETGECLYEPASSPGVFFENKHGDGETFRFKFNSSYVSVLYKKCITVSGKIRLCFHT